MKPRAAAPLLPMETGVSLVEALVALAVLALGVMGMAALQTRTLLETRATNGRAIAVQLVTDLSERMRANPGIRDRSLVGPSNPYLIEWGASPPTINCWTRACDPQDLAGFDLMQWRASLAQHLPLGDARVFASATDPGEVGILIGWPLLPDGPPVPVAPGGAAVTCREGLMCHLVFVRP
jgi:type IV pilus assembly protein PilV